MDLSSSSVSANLTTVTTVPTTTMNLPSSLSLSANSTTTPVDLMNLTSIAPTSSSTTVSPAMDLPSTAVSANSTTVTAAVGIMNLTSTTVSPSSTTVSAVMNLPSSSGSPNSTTTTTTTTTTTAAVDLPSIVSSSSTTTSVSSAAMDLPSSVSSNTTTTVSPAMDLPSTAVSANSTTTTTTTTGSPAIDLPSTVSANTTTVTAVTDLSSAAVSPSSTTTVPVYDIPSEEINCLPIKDPNVIVNTTSVADGTVVHVECKPSFTLVAPRTNTDFVTCLGGRWIPLTPTCNPVQSNSAPVGVIVGCTVGGFVCLVLVIVALFMLNKSIKERKDQRERNKEFYDKMDQIGLYINESFQDPVGMPVLTMDTRDTDLRGRVALSNSNPSASSEKEEPPDAGKLGADLF